MSDTLARKGFKGWCESRPLRLEEESGVEGSDGDQLPHALGFHFAARAPGNDLAAFHH